LADSLGFRPILWLLANFRFFGRFYGVWPILGFSADFLDFRPILSFLIGFKVQVGFKADFSIFDQI
jgi:hypothetical protein